MFSLGIFFKQVVGLKKKEISYVSWPYTFNSCPCSGGVTDEQKQDLATSLTEISKATSNGGRLMGHADQAQQKMAAKDKEIVMMNLEKLRVTLEEAEEVLWLEKMTQHMKPPFVSSKLAKF